jgi:hypothetical protein
VSPDDAEEFTQALGHAMGGNFRIAALAIKLGAPKALGQTPEQWIEHNLGRYVKLSIEERRNTVQELTNEGFSLREIAGALGISHEQVRRDRVTNATPNEPRDQVVFPNPVTNVTPELSLMSPSNLATRFLVDLHSAIRGLSQTVIGQLTSKEEIRSVFESLQVVREQIDFALIQLGDMAE